MTGACLRDDGKEVMVGMRAAEALGLVLFEGPPGVARSDLALTAVCKKRGGSESAETRGATE